MSEEYVDWEGNTGNSTQTFERILVPEENYDMVVKAIELAEVKRFTGEGTQQRIKFILSIDDAQYPDYKGKELVHFISPMISKGSTNKKTGQVFSNSKLYDTLTDLGMKDKAKAEIGSVLKTDFPRTITEWLGTQLIGKKVRCSTKVSKRNTPEAYSLVDRIKKVY